MMRPASLAALTFLFGIESLAAAQSPRSPAPARPTATPTPTAAAPTTATAPTTAAPTATATPTTTATAPQAPPPYAYPPTYPPPYYAPGYPPYYAPPPGYWAPPPPVQLKEQPYKQGAPIPEGYHVEERHPRWALLTGGIMLGSAYFTGLFINTSGSSCVDSFSSSSSRCRDDRWVVAIPIAGSFIDMGRTNSSSDRMNDFLVGSGQVAGAIFLIYGIASTSPKLVPDYQRAGVSLSPLLASSGGGVTFTLRQ